jgi:hypothetical protein
MRRADFPERKGLLVRLSSVPDDSDDVLKIKTFTLRAVHVPPSGSASVATYGLGSVADTVARRGMVTSPAVDSADPILKGGPVRWSVRLAPDTAAMRSAIRDSLRAHGYSTDLRGTAVLDAEIRVAMTDTIRRDSVQQRLDVYSLVVGNLSQSVWLSRSAGNRDTIQVFDSITAKLDSNLHDTSSLTLRFYSSAGDSDSVVFGRYDTLMQSFYNSSWPLRFLVQRRGDSVLVSLDSVAASLTQESQANRNGDYNKSSLFGANLRLAAQRPFSALLNWPKQKPQILLIPNSLNSSEWWQMTPDLAHMNVRLVLLPVGDAQ